MPRSPLFGAAAIALTIFAWSSAFPLIGIALTKFEPLPLAAGRFGLAAAIALCWLVAARPERPSIRDAGKFLLCGLFGVALYNALLNAGQQSVSAGAASFLVNAGPIITAILAAIFLAERFGALAWAGSLVAFLGVGIIASGQPGGLNLGAGASLVLGAAVCQASYFVLQRPLVPRYGALACTAYTFVAGAILLAPWLPEAAAVMVATSPSDPAVVSVIGLAVLPSILGFASWTFALNQFGAARAANFLYLIPPCAIALDYVLTGQTPGYATWLGGVLAIAGVALVNLRRRAPPKP